MGIGERIRLKRKESRFTQSELAKLVNVSSQVISNWERGYTDPNHDDVARLSEALGCSTEFLHGKKVIKNTLSEKDKKDMAKRMQKMKEDLIEGRSDGEGLNFMGEPMSEEAIESLLEALEHAERIATLTNKKFTPKKYREKE